jgi:predicted nucleic acid-binding protein
MRVYLDNCAYNRPFDNQKDVVIHIETEAKLIIQQMIKDNKLELVWSDVVDYENNDNPFEERCLKIAEWKELASGNIAMNDEIIEKARKYMEIGLRQKDAAHLASALYGKSDCFITVDKKILNKSIEDIIVIDPVDFLRRLQNDG